MTISPGRGTDQRHRQVGELRIGEPLGRHEDEVDVVRRDVGGELVDRRRRRAVHRHRPQPEPGRGVDLVAHQREQRRDEQRRPEPGIAQQPGREEVDRALAPSGALDDEDTGPVAHQCLDGFTLMRSELRVGSPGQPAQGVEQFVGLSRLTHRGPFCRGGVATAPNAGRVVRSGHPQDRPRLSPAWAPPRERAGHRDEKRAPFAPGVPPRRLSPPALIDCMYQPPHGGALGPYPRVLQRWVTFSSRDPPAHTLCTAFITQRGVTTGGRCQRMLPRCGMSQGRSRPGSSSVCSHIHR